jgi:diguanylate cyclase (GGDEF)-like protein
MLHLQVRRERGPNVLTERGRVTQTLGEQLSVALANFRLREIMRSQSSRDPLTDLYNRRFMEESLYRELRRAAREGGSVGVLMVDIDHFKELNDTYGHAAGDVALRTVGEFLKAAVRGEDIACRYGGDEFVVILPKSSLADTEQRAQALRRDVKSLGVLGPNPIFPTLTMSIGVVAFPEHGGESAALLAAADRALYGAKTAGRDRVVVADVSDDVERVRSAEA